MPFASVAKSGVSTLLISADPFFNSPRDRLVWIQKPSRPASWMTVIGKSRPVRAAALRLSSANRRSSPNTSPAGTECLDIFSPPDLGVPATEQGAGLLNSYKAVLPRRIDQGQSRISGCRRPVPVIVDEPAQHDMRCCPG
jgi:hypothetical protein